jgi:hypothetical protein
MNLEIYSDIDNEKAKIAGINVVEKQQEKNSSIPLKKKHSLLHQVIIGSSMYSNLEQVFRTDNGGSVTCLNGIRLFSMIWIIFGHTFNYMVDRSNFFLLCKIYSKCPLKDNYLDRHNSPVQLILNVGYRPVIFQ